MGDMHDMGVERSMGALVGKPGASHGTCPGHSRLSWNLPDVASNSKVSKF